MTLQAVISKGTMAASKMKKFHPAAKPKASSTYRPAKRMKGDEMGKYVTISAMPTVTARMKEHHIVNARNRLAGPPLITPFPIWTYSAVPMVPPMPTVLYSQQVNNQGGGCGVSGRTNQLDMARLEGPVCVIADETTNRGTVGRLMSKVALFIFRGISSRCSLEGTRQAGALNVYAC